MRERLLGEEVIERPFYRGAKLCPVAIRMSFCRLIFWIEVMLSNEASHILIVWCMTVQRFTRSMIVHHRICDVGLLHAQEASDTNRGTSIHAL